jgi:hypothetical protein
LYEALCGKHADLAEIAAQLRRAGKLCGPGADPEAFGHRSHGERAGDSRRMELSSFTRAGIVRYDRGGGVSSLHPAKKFVIPIERTFRTRQARQ